MAYIGNIPAESYASFEKQVFTIVNSQTAYTLTHAVTNENDIRLVVNNVVQEPGSGKAYTAANTTLTLSAALVNGTDEMYCVYLGRALQTVNPPNASVGNSQTAPTIITGQTAETSIATDDTILIHDTSASALRKMTRANFVSGIGGANTPAFHVTLSSNQALSNTTNTKVTFNNEVYDSDGKFASNKFTPGVVGKYILSVCLMIDGDTNSTVNTTRLFIYKNGSSIQFVETSSAANPGRIHAPSISLLVDSDADDYFEVYAYISTSGSGQFVQGGTAGSFFAGYKIIT